MLLFNKKALEIGDGSLEVDSSVFRQRWADLHTWFTMRSRLILKSDTAWVKTKISGLFFLLISKMLALPPSHADVPARGLGSALAPPGRSSGVLNPGIASKPKGDCGAPSAPTSGMLGIARDSCCDCCWASGAAGLGHVRERSSLAYLAHGSRAGGLGASCGGGVGVPTGCVSGLGIPGGGFS